MVIFWTWVIFLENSFFSILFCIEFFIDHCSFSKQLSLPEKNVNKKTNFRKVPVVESRKRNRKGRLIQPDYRVGQRKKKADKVSAPREDSKTFLCWAFWVITFFKSSSFREIHYFITWFFFINLSNWFCISLFIHSHLQSISLYFVQIFLFQSFCSATLNSVYSAHHPYRRNCLRRSPAKRRSCIKKQLNLAIKETFIVSLF